MLKSDVENNSHGQFQYVLHVTATCSKTQCNPLQSVLQQIYDVYSSWTVRAKRELVNLVNRDRELSWASYFSNMTPPLRRKKHQRFYQNEMIKWLMYSSAIYS